MDTSVKQILEKNNIKIVDVAGVPITVFSYNNLGSAVKELLESKKNYYIVFVSVKDIVFSKFKKELAETLKKAVFLIPVSSSICKGAKFLKREIIPQRIFSFEFVIKLLGEIENYGRSLYLIGGSHSVIKITESNIKSSFPGLTVVGRYAGYFKKEIEKDIITAIKKSSPSLILAGSGLPGKRYWISRKNSQFNPGISLWIGDDFNIFAGKKTKPSKSQVGIFVEKIGNIFKNPLKVFNIFIYIFYFFMLIYFRIRKK
jgi:N-acetylglucosaminyldiphosphoundecaprenol N-acetyl-beta-D-mannosaminyltransferase